MPPGGGGGVENGGGGEVGGGRDLALVIGIPGLMGMGMVGMVIGG